MPIEFQCPGCNQTLKVPDEVAGRQAKCPQCATIVQIPNAAAPTPPPAPSPPRSADPNPYASPRPDVFQAPPQSAAETGELRNQVVDLGSILNYSMDIWKNNLGILVGTTLVLFVVNIAFSIVQTLANESGDEELAAVISLVTTLLSNVVGLFLGIGQTQIILKLVRRQPAEFAELFMGGSRFLPVLGACILAGLALMVGLALCIVPGIILMLFFWPFYWIVVDDRAPVMDSFTLARTITKGNEGTTFLIWLVGVGITLLGLLALCIGVIFAAPLVSTMWSVAYLSMSGQISLGRSASSAY